MLKTIISPAQALLLLIKNTKDNPEKLEKYKKWYLSGISTSSEHEEFSRLCNDAFFEKYQVNFSPKIINDDPTRRYFETHLAYRTLEYNLNVINQKTLQDHVDGLWKMVKSRPIANLNHIQEILGGKFEKNDINLYKEYAVYIQRLDNGKIFSHFSKEERLKIKLIAQASFLGVISAQVNDLPIDIYGQGIYSEIHKGKIMVKEQETTRSGHMGLMKGYMPLTADDIALSEETPLLKPSDQATYRVGALWVDQNFQKLVHPFSNSISGTMLCQLRNLAKIRRVTPNHLLTSSNKMLNSFGQLFISTMLFGSGGHTLNEYSSPLSLPSVKKEFRELMTPPISLETMFYEHNKKAFNLALEETLDYNQHILSQHAIREKLKINPVFQRAKISNNFISDIMGLIINAKNDYQNHLDQQFSSSWRLGAQKQKLILKYLNTASTSLGKGNFEAVKSIIGELKKELKTQFGETNFRGKPSYALELIEDLSNKIGKLHQNASQRIDEIKGVVTNLHQKETDDKNSTSKRDNLDI